ncbi:class A sortase [Limosilactobacillus secaliphilus]|uniref:Sortase n=1 Tax=Limosilactobacillus secaliphilus TaxID=396268 RepID=A0A0R2I251_9LACO|nr:class A sortase [Limosilactobacillus secaliphilus]KRN59250.1 sortase [Limosilactobacillus secaliphilus]
MKRKNWLRWTAVVILLVASVIMIFNNQIKSYLVNTYHPQVSRQSIKKNESKKGNYDFSNVKDLNLQTVAKNRANKQNVHIIGTIAIPDIDMSIPIAKGVDNNTLALAAGTMREDQKMGKGNYALAGHNMAHGSKILFSPLYYHAKVGQKVYLTDLDKVYTYKITQRKFIDADRVDVVNDTKKPIITLITCDATGARRLMIRGKLVKTQKFKNAPAKVQKALSSKYTNQ